MSNDKTELEFLEMKKMVDSVHQRHLDHRKNLIKDGTDKMEFWSADLSPDEEETFNRVLEWIVAKKRWYNIPGLFGACALYGSDWCKKAYLKCKDLIPLDALYNVTIDVYAEDGFDFPKEIIAEIKELRPLDYLRFLPRRLKAKDVVRVFRVSSTPPNEISNLSSEISWWANPQAAFGTWKFRQKKCSQTPWYIYTAHISHNDIIAYNPYLDEVMQLNNVFDVHHIDLAALHKLCCLTDFHSTERCKMTSRRPYLYIMCPSVRYPLMIVLMLSGLLIPKRHTLYGSMSPLRNIKTVTYTMPKFRYIISESTNQTRGIAFLLLRVLPI